MIGLMLASLAGITRIVLALDEPEPAATPACPTMMLTFARSLSSQSSSTDRLATAGSSLASVTRGVPASTAPAP